MRPTDDDISGSEAPKPDREYTFMYSWRLADEDEIAEVLEWWRKRDRNPNAKIARLKKMGAVFVWRETALGPHGEDDVDWSCGIVMQVPGGDPDAEARADAEIALEFMCASVRAIDEVDLWPEHVMRWAPEIDDEVRRALQSD